MSVREITPQAWHAIKAASLRKQCGAFASRRYAEKNGVHPSLYRLACQLAAASN